MIDLKEFINELHSKNYSKSKAGSLAGGSRKPYMNNTLKGGSNNDPSSDWNNPIGQEWIGDR
jgi:hypothetical protein